MGITSSGPIDAKVTRLENSCSYATQNIKVKRQIEQTIIRDFAKQLLKEHFNENVESTVPISNILKVLIEILRYLGGSGLCCMTLRDLNISFSCQKC